MWLVTVRGLSTYEDHDEFVVLVDGDVGHVWVLKVVELELDVPDLLVGLDGLDLGQLVPYDLLQLAILHQGRVQNIAPDMAAHVLLVNLVCVGWPYSDVLLHAGVQLKSVHVRLEAFVDGAGFLRGEDVTGDVDPRAVEETVEVESGEVEDGFEQSVALVLVRALEHLTDANHLLQNVREGLMLGQDLNKFLVLEDALEHNQHILINIHGFKRLQFHSSLDNIHNDRHLVERVEHGVASREHALDVAVEVQLDVGAGGFLLGLFGGWG